MNRSPHRTKIIAALQASAQRMTATSLNTLFAQDPDRTATCSGEAGTLFADYSRQHLDKPLLRELHALARDSNVAQGLSDIAGAEVVNTTEGRAACHNLLRAAAGDTHEAAAVRAMQDQLRERSAAFANGAWPATGSRITHIINIGIGGSDLGPRLLCDALAGVATPLADTRFVANVDPSNLARSLSGCSPATTLFIVSSKSFGTEETLTNAAAARRWLESELPAAQANNHFVAVTANPDAALAAGYPGENIIRFPSWVGGRFSVWSAIGLPVALAFGMNLFAEFLAGGAAIDQHALGDDTENNIAVTLGLLDVWNTSFMGRPTLAVLPYDHNFRLLPAYLQQLMMESNGKSVTRSGMATDLTTCPVVWGSEGTNGQHSFHQLLHQGVPAASCDFLLPLATGTDNPAQHDALVAHCLSQSLVLMRGQTLAEVEAALQNSGLSPGEAKALAPHKVMPGNRPSTTICYPRSGARTLGALIALYEYRVLVASLIWGINPFDQWGVELGKKESGTIAAEIAKRSTGGGDSATRNLLHRYYQHQQD